MDIDQESYGIIHLQNRYSDRNGDINTVDFDEMVTKAVEKVIPGVVNISEVKLMKDAYLHIHPPQFSDRILIFYGTCGHSLSNLEKDFEDLGCQLYFLKDEKGEIVEDCISLALGGNDVYARTLANGEGTFYLTPMWASNWDEKQKDNAILSSGSDTKFLKLYGNTAKINTGLSYEPDFDKNVRDFALFFNLKIVELQGSTKIAELSYQNAKRFP